MLMIDQRKEFTLSSPYFDKMRTDLSTYISNAPKAMASRNSEACSIALKIDIAYEHATAKDESAPSGVRETTVPNVTYKLVLTMQAKSERKGDVVRAGHELVQDDSGKYFILSKEEASGQLNLFNSYDELRNGQDVDADEQEDDDE